jgi:hypothetical protein
MYAYAMGILTPPPSPLPRAKLSRGVVATTYKVCPVADDTERVDLVSLEEVRIVGVVAVVVAVVQHVCHLTNAHAPRRSRPEERRRKRIKSKR